MTNFNEVFRTLLRSDEEFLSRFSEEDIPASNAQIAVRWGEMEPNTVLLAIDWNTSRGQGRRWVFNIRSASDDEVSDCEDFIVAVYDKNDFRYCP